MPIPLLALAGIAAGGQILNTIGQSRSAAQARRDAQQRMSDITALTQPFVGGGRSQASTNFEDFLRQMSGPTAFQGQQTTYSNVAPTLIDPGQFQNFQLPSWVQTEVRNADPLTAQAAGFSTASGAMNDVNMGSRLLDFSRLMGPNAVDTRGFNSAQDALMQLVRGNGGYNSITAQLDPTAGMNLNEIVSGNTRFDMSPMFDALAPIEDRTRETALAELNAQAGSLGRRFGTAQTDRAADLLTRLTEEANLRRQNLAFQASEAAQGRRLQAADAINARDSLLNQVLMADQAARVNATGNQIQGAGVASRNAADVMGTQASSNAAYNSAVAALLQQAMGSQTQLALGNQRTGADISMFNAGAGNAASLANAAAANRLAETNAANFLTAQGQRIGNNNAQNTFNMQGAGLQSDALSRLAQILSSNATASNNAAQFNATNALNTGQFNARQAFDAWLANQTNQQNFNSTMLGGFGALMSDSNNQLARALQAIALRAGQPLPPTSAGTTLGGLGQGLGDIASIIALLSGRR